MRTPQQSRSLATDQGPRPTGHGPRTTDYVARTMCALLALLGVGCRQDMHDQPKVEPFEASEFFADGMASRKPVGGTVARGQLREDDHFYRGLDPDGNFAAELPMPLTAELLERGRERYDIFCSPCHSRTGDGDGMVVRRGFKAPQSLHLERLRASPPGYYFDVISSGFGEMPSYASQVPVADRWAIVAYIQALQLSRHAERSRLDAEDLAALAAPETATEEGGH